MQDENIKSPEQINLPDFTDLEKSIDQLVDVVKKDFEEREKEKNDLAAKEKKEQADLLIQQKKEKEELLLKEKEELTEVKSNEEKLLEDKTLDETYKENLLSVQTLQAETSTDLLTEIQTLNSNVLLQNEKLDNQNDLIIESSLTLIITIVVVAAVKVFIGQITKW